jgi:hypothetical protein
MALDVLTEVTCATCGRIEQARPYDGSLGPAIGRFEQRPHGWTVLLNGEVFLCSEKCSRLRGQMMEHEYIPDEIDMELEKTRKRDG